jgi:hypothetical protein
MCCFVYELCRSARSFRLFGAPPVRMCSPSPFFFPSPNHFPFKSWRVGVTGLERHCWFGSDQVRSKNLVYFSLVSNILRALLRPRSIRAVRSLHGLPKVSDILLDIFCFVLWSRAGRPRTERNRGFWSLSYVLCDPPYFHQMHKDNE